MDVSFGKKNPGGQKDPGDKCANKTSKDGETKFAIKVASESHTARNGTKKSPEGKKDQQTPWAGGAHKGTKMEIRESSGPQK